MKNPPRKSKYERPKERLQPPEILPNRVVVPDSTIIAITHHDNFNDTTDEVVMDLRKEKKRDWMSQHAYFCLPLTMGNQHGFAIRSLFDVELLWNGGAEPKDLSITITDPDYAPNGKQIIKSHFGAGIVTYQIRFSLRTPEGVNLLVFNPPNYFIDGIQSLTAVVETDNLRRDFTFNLKVTRPNVPVFIKKGEPIAAFLPYPRRFFDPYKLAKGNEALPADVIAEERRTSDYFAQERSQIDSQYAGANGFRYLDGEDIYGIPFKDHQKKIDG